MLIVVGLAGYFGSGQASPTALIPSALGALLALLGFVGRDPAKRKHALHGGLVIALIGMAGTFSRAIKLFSILGGEMVERPQAIYASAITFVLCLIFLLAGIKSFADARRS
jgi:hypothetical protein